MATRMPGASTAEAWLSIIGIAVCFLLLVSLFTALVTSLIPSFLAAGPRAETTKRLTGACLGEVVTLGLLSAYLRWRRGSIKNLGLHQPASPAGWIVAALATTAVVGLMLAGPLRGKAPLLELSSFHLYNSITIGVVAGFCEESLFRGFVMTELARSGAGNLVQVLASGFVFGLARLGVAGLGGTASPRPSIAAMVLPAGIGMLCGGVYLASKRSLRPVIAGHIVTTMILEPWLMLAIVGSAIAPGSQ